MHNLACKAHARARAHEAFIFYSRFDTCVLLLRFLLVLAASSTMEAASENEEYFFLAIRFISVQFKIECTCSVKPIRARYHLSTQVSPALPLKQFQCSSDWPCPFLVLSRECVVRFHSLQPSFHTTDGVTSFCFLSATSDEMSEIYFVLHTE